MIIARALFALSAVAAQAQEAPPAPRPAPAAAAGAPDETQALALAGSLGRALYAYDRAAWVGSDALVARVPKDRLGRDGGYIVEPATADTLRMSFYSGAGAEARVIFTADVRDGKVIASALLDTPAPLTAPQAALVAARNTAATAAIRAGYRPCTGPTFNTVALPTRPGGPILVYLLSPQVDTRRYPAGGHYRIIVGPDGKVLAQRPYTHSCIDLAAGAEGLPAGAKPVGVFVNHVMDPVPTEIHVFLSYNLRSPVFVGTEGRLWRVDGGRIAPSDIKAPAPPR